MMCWQTWKTMAITVVLLQLSISSMKIFCLSSHADRIHKLPGQPHINFQQFSGYVTVDEMKQRSLFYYFVESKTNPSSKPLVLWLNGGPGCSSIGIGAFSENGPFRPNGEVLIKNDHSWNREANMLYLETPVGVGFSYAKARDNLVFLLGWFNKFPQYKHRDLFLTGESYAGHYIPQLAKLMIGINKKKKIFNLKGIALGNPLLEYATDFNSRAEFFWSHGLISDSTYKMFTAGCNYSRYVSEYYRNSISPLCSKVMRKVSRETSKFVDKYDVTLDVCISSVLSQSKVICPQTHQANESIDVCVDDKVTNYLNRRDVQKALHAELVGVPTWDVCNNVLDYNMLNLEVPTLHVVGSLIKAGVRVLIYSGDQDSVIPLTGSRSLVQKLARQLSLNTTVPYRVWFEGHQVGGWTQVYGNILSFATIRGASHEAPFSQPQRSLVLFNSFLEDRPLPEIL
ncbi:serine carboxypeptidase-like 45 isoform X3 [Cicer arietinum]|uniref:Carboxypeptidase n=1 Tax=Cicer arietinum TaxID=3827 RepID=A0A1S3E8N4_CICAR|nr:serine carboxypeptidase-like 45 isoform X2 [Cicer arietinum]